MRTNSGETRRGCLQPFSFNHFSFSSFFPFSPELLLASLPLCLSPLEMALPGRAFLLLCVALLLASAGAALKTRSRLAALLRRRARAASGGRLLEGTAPDGTLGGMGIPGVGGGMGMPGMAGGAGGGMPGQASSGAAQDESTSSSTSTSTTTSGPGFIRVEDADLDDEEAEDAGREVDRYSSHTRNSTEFPHVVCKKHGHKCDFLLKGSQRPSPGKSFSYYNAIGTQGSSLSTFVSNEEAENQFEVKVTNSQNPNDWGDFALSLANSIELCCHDHITKVMALVSFGPEAGESIARGLCARGGGGWCCMKSVGAAELARASCASRAHTDPPGDDLLGTISRPP